MVTIPGEPSTQSDEPRSIFGAIGASLIPCGESSGISSTVNEDQHRLEHRVTRPSTCDEGKVLLGHATSPSGAVPTSNCLDLAIHSTLERAVTTSPNYDRSVWSSDTPI